MARKALVAVAEGRDPNQEKRAAHQAEQNDRATAHDAIENIVSTFIERHLKANTRDSTSREMSRLLNKNVAPEWKGRRLQDITRQDVITLMDAMIDRGAAVSANRTLAVTRRMFNWAIERGLVESSPCERLRGPTTEKARDRILTDDELIALWQGCEEIGWPFGPLVQLLILTGQRRDEVAEMRWAEVDLDRKLWTIPRERVKNDKGHDVALSELAVSVFRSIPRIAGSKSLVFSTTGETAVSGFSRAKRRLDDAMQAQIRKQAGQSGKSPAGIDIPDWRLHDLRRTVASGMARLGVNLPTIEKVLNHSSGSFAGVVGIYQRHSFAGEKRLALDAWGQFIATLISSKPNEP